MSSEEKMISPRLSKRNRKPPVLAHWGLSFCRSIMIVIVSFAYAQYNICSRQNQVFPWSFTAYSIRMRLTDCLVWGLKWIYFFLFKSINIAQINSIRKRNSITSIIRKSVNTLGLCIKYRIIHVTIRIIKSINSCSFFSEFRLHKTYARCNSLTKIIDVKPKRIHRIGSILYVCWYLACKTGNARQRIISNSKIKLAHNRYFIFFMELSLLVYHSFALKFTSADKYKN